MAKRDRFVDVAQVADLLRQLDDERLAGAPRPRWFGLSVDTPRRVLSVAWEGKGWQIQHQAGQSRGYLRIRVPLGLAQAVQRWSV